MYNCWEQNLDNIHENFLNYHNKEEYLKDEETLYKSKLQKELEEIEIFYDESFKNNIRNNSDFENIQIFNENIFEAEVEEKSEIWKIAENLGFFEERS